jgi:hypothetical protein
MDSDIADIELQQLYPYHRSCQLGSGERDYTKQKDGLGGAA